MQPTTSQDDVCPDCGDFSTLVEVTGFCLKCTKRRHPNSAVCMVCGRIEIRGQFRNICQYCQKEQWFQKNADKLEVYIRAGLTFGMAITKVQFDNRPLCISCGEKIKRGKEVTLFCSKNKECRTLARYFKFLRFRKSLSREQAIVVINERIASRT